MKIGFIGTGNMGSAVACAVSLVLKEKDELYLSNRTKEKAEVLAEKIHGMVTDNESIMKECDWIFLGVKPYQIISLLEEHKLQLNDRNNQPVIVSMAAGIELSQMIETGVQADFARIMPNTPMFVQKGCTAICGRYGQKLKELLSQSGTVIEIEESQIDAFSALAGCGPAFVDVFMEALADGAVACGIKRNQAYEIISQLLIGSASLQKETGLHPGILKDQVCSPSGSTIQGVRALEENGFRAATINAVIKAYEKNKQMR